MRPSTRSRRLATTAKWKTKPQISSKELFSHFRSTAQGSLAGVFESDLENAKTVLHENYEVAYIQHAPMEPARRGRMERRQGHRLDGHPEPFRRPQ